MDGAMPERLVTARGVAIDVAATTDDDVGELLALFRAIVAAGEGYPQAPDEPVTAEAFEAYWLAPATATVVARTGDGALAGAYTMKPNGPGRAAHVANAGYVVADGQRGRGIGEALVRHSFDVARAHGFDAMQFNFVFETNPARRLYERLGFTDVGRVPAVIDGEAVHIYWRAL
jgi:ribosomal protein S18 acetylase RimI-like enzyme